MAHLNPARAGASVQRRAFSGSPGGRANRWHPVKRPAGQVHQTMPTSARARPEFAAGALEIQTGIRTSGGTGYARPTERQRSHANVVSRGATACRRGSCPQRHGRCAGAETLSWRTACPSRSARRRRGRHLSRRAGGACLVPHTEEQPRRQSTTRGRRSMVRPRSMVGRTYVPCAHAEPHHVSSGAFGMTCTPARDAGRER